MKDLSSNLTLGSSKRNRIWQRIGPQGFITVESNSKVTYPVDVIPALIYSFEGPGAWKDFSSINFLRISMARTTSSSVSAALMEIDSFFGTFGEEANAFSKILVNLAMGISSNSLLPANLEKHQQLDLGGSLCPCSLLQHRVCEELDLLEHRTPCSEAHETFLLRVSLFQKYSFLEKRSFPDSPSISGIIFEWYRENSEKRNAFPLKSSLGSKDLLRI